MAEELVEAEAYYVKVDDGRPEESEHASALLVVRRYY